MMIVYESFGDKKLRETYFDEDMNNISTEL